MEKGENKRTDRNKRIFKAIVTVGCMTLLVKMANLVQHLVIAGHFGTSDALDAFYIAYLLPSVTFNVIASAFGASLMPVYINVRDTQGLKSAQRLVASTTLWCLGLSTIVASVFALTADFILPLLGSGFDAAKISLTRSIFFVLLPIIILKGLSSVWATVLNSQEHFALVALAPAIIPVTTVACLVTTVAFLGVYALAAGLTIGVAVECCIVAWAAIRKGAAGGSKGGGLDKPMKTVLKQFLPMAAGALLMSGTDLVDQSMAAMLSSGSVAALNFGNKAIAFLIGIGAMAVGTAVFPHFSQMVARQEWAELKRTLSTYSLSISLITIPLALGLFFFSEPLVSLVFQRGAFDISDTVLVGKVQAFYSLQLPFYVLGIMGVRLLSALAKNQVIMLISGVNLSCNILLNLIFMDIWGVAGIGLSTSAVYAISLVQIYMAVVKEINSKLNGV